MNASLRSLKVFHLNDTLRIWSISPSPGGFGHCWTTPSSWETSPHHVCDSSFSGVQSSQSSGSFTGLRYLLRDMNLVAFSSSSITGHQLGADLPPWEVGKITFTLITGPMESENQDFCYTFLGLTNLKLFSESPLSPWPSTSPWTVWVFYVKFETESL